jgi:hypothetical protein
MFAATLMASARLCGKPRFCIKNSPDADFSLKKSGHGVNCVRMTAVEFKEITSLLMLIPFAIVLLTAVSFAVLSVRNRRLLNQLPPNRSPLEARHSSLACRSSFRPAVFTQPNRWMAVKAKDPMTVLAALDLHEPAACSCDDGFVDAGEHRVFITPPASGWVLVLGSGLPDPAEDIDRCYHFLMEMSRKLGHIQFFSANRVLNHHAWAIVDRGMVIRAYAWAGETLWNQGAATSAEKDLDLRCFSYASDRLVFGQRDGSVPNAEKICRLASLWSVDPMAVSESAWVNEQGIIGNFFQFKPH